MLEINKMIDEFEKKHNITPVTIRFSEKFLHFVGADLRTDQVVDADHDLSLKMDDMIKKHNENVVIKKSR